MPVTPPPSAGPLAIQVEIPHAYAISRMGGRAQHSPQLAPQRVVRALVSVEREYPVVPGQRSAEIPLCPDGDTGQNLDLGTRVRGSDNRLIDRASVHHYHFVRPHRCLANGIRYTGPFVQRRDDDCQRYRRAVELARRRFVLEDRVLVSPAIGRRREMSRPPLMWGKDPDKMRRIH